MRWRPVAPEDLAGLIAEWLATSSGTLRVAIDGPACASPDALAAALVEPLRALGRPVELVRSCTFWHDASLRLEYGREDPDSFRSWLDHAALRREVLEPVTARGTFLPSLRDPVTNRSTRQPPCAVTEGTVLVVSGELLLGLGLPFDRTVHLALSPAARVRRGDPALAWTLPAYDEYDAGVDPIGRADLVVRLEDPRHPAVLGPR